MPESTWQENVLLATGAVSFSRWFLKEVLAPISGTERGRFVSWVGRAQVDGIAAVTSCSLGEENGTRRKLATLSLATLAAPGEYLKFLWILINDTKKNT